jgi:hypothetical protein
LEPGYVLDAPILAPAATTKPKQTTVRNWLYRHGLAAITLFGEEPKIDDDGRFLFVEEWYESLSPPPNGRMIDR